MPQVNITLNFATIEEAAIALAKLAGATVTQAPGKPADAPAATTARSPRTASVAESPKADAAAKNTDGPAAEKPTAPAASATSAAKPAEVKPEQLTALIMQFVPNAEHKAAVLALLATYTKDDGTPVGKGKELQAKDRADAYAKIAALADELGLKVPA